jgi:hypothetical protein
MPALRSATWKDRISWLESSRLGAAPYPGWNVLAGQQALPDSIQVLVFIGPTLPGGV